MGSITLTLIYSEKVVARLLESVAWDAERSWLERDELEVGRRTIGTICS